MKCSHSLYWGNACEIKFINGLGTFTLAARRVPPKDSMAYHLHLLKAYRKAMVRRHDWGEMDFLEILHHVNARIKKIEKSVGKRHGII